MKVRPWGHIEESRLEKNVTLGCVMLLQQDRISDFGLRWFHMHLTVSVLFLLLLLDGSSTSRDIVTLRTTHMMAVMTALEYSRSASNVPSTGVEF